MPQITSRTFEVSGGPNRLLILIPIYNDWEVVGLLLKKVDAQLLEHRLHADILLVDDGSTNSPPVGLALDGYRAIESVDILTLRRNLGHQRAIAIGLAYVDAKTLYQAVLVMDGDGEDAPEDIPRLVETLKSTGGSKIIFAERARRSEGWLFRAGYIGYKMLHLVLTGRTVRVGNFSIIPAPLLHRLTAVSELWNHYSAAVFQARLPHTEVPTRRAPRLLGRSKMNLASLIVHGLSALSVYSDMIGVRLLIATSASILLASMVLALVITIRLTTEVAVSGWAPIVAGLVFLLLLQLLTASLSFVFLILHGRGGIGFLPSRDYSYFVDRLVSVWPSRGNEMQTMPFSAVPTDHQENYLPTHR